MAGDTILEMQIGGVRADESTQSFCKGGCNRSIRVCPCLDESGWHWFGGCLHKQIGGIHRPRRVARLRDVFVIGSALGVVLLFLFKRHFFFRPFCLFFLS